MTIYLLSLAEGLPHMVTNEGRGWWLNVTSEGYQGNYWSTVCAVFMQQALTPISTILMEFLCAVTQYILYTCTWWVMLSPQDNWQFRSGEREPGQSPIIGSCPVCMLTHHVSMFYHYTHTSQLHFASLSQPSYCKFCNIEVTWQFEQTPPNVS